RWSMSLPGKGLVEIENDANHPSERGNFDVLILGWRGVDARARRGPGFIRVTRVVQPERPDAGRKYVAFALARRTTENGFECPGDPLFVHGSGFEHGSLGESGGGFSKRD